MMKIDFEKFVEYHNNPNKEYSVKELEEIRANEFAMHLFCPTMYVLEEFLALNIDFDNIYNLSNYERLRFYRILQKRFLVPMDVITIKIDELCDKYKDSDIRIEDIILKDFFYLYDNENNKISLNEALTKCFPKAHEKLKKYIKEKYGVESYTKIKKCKIIFKKNKHLNN